MALYQLAVLPFLICSAVAFDHEDLSPADCNFNVDPCQWQNGDENGLQWQRGSKSAFQRSYTWPFLNDPPAGPDSEFMFVQTHRDRDARNKWVEFKSPAVTVDGERCLIFDYFNNMANINEDNVLYGALQLYIRHYNKSESMIAHFRKSKIKNWLRAEVSLPLGEYRLVFKSFFDNDLTTASAVDDIGLFNTRCGEMVIDRVTGDCGFDSGLCGYLQQGLIPFQTYRKEELFDGKGSIYSPTGYFLGVTYADYRYRSLAMQLKLPTLNIARESCLYFTRHNSVGVPDNKLELLNALNVKGTGPLGNFTVHVPKIFSDQWFGFLVFLTPGQYSIILEAKVNGEFDTNDYVGIDAVEVWPQTCNETLQRLDSLKEKAFACYTNKNQNLCENGGSCLSRGLKTYKCICPVGYYGDRCQWLSPCHKDPCVHGTCTLVGRKQSYCNCEEGYHNKYCNATAECPSPPPEIENGKIVSITNTSYWGVTTYRCRDGFQMVGSDSSICRKGWTTPPKCKLIICGPVPTIENGIFKNDSIAQPGQNFLPTIAPFLPTINSTVTVHCNFENYEYKDGDRVLRCGESGGWVGIVGQCVRKQECENPPYLINGNLTRVTTIAVGGLATYECNSGFIQVGVGAAHCMKDLRWHYLPECIPHCPVKTGRFGSRESITVEITECETNNIHVRYPTKESCRDPVKHVIMKGDHEPSDNIRFYGEEMCFSVRTTKKATSKSPNKYTYYDLPDEVKCESFCLPFKNGAKRVISTERILYDPLLSVERKTISFVTKGNGDD